MSDLLKIYKRRLTSDFLRHNVADGNIVTPGQIQSFIESLDLNQLPLSSLNQQPFHGKSSAKQYNEQIERIGIDIRVLYDYLDEIVAQDQRLTNYAVAQFVRYIERLKELDSKISNMLLLANKSEGYNEYFYESFDDLDGIDWSVSDGYVDIKTSTYRTSTRLTDVYLRGNKFTAAFDFDKSVSYVSANQLDDFGLENLFDQSVAPWTFQVVTRHAHPTIRGELVIDLNGTYDNIHRIEIDASTYGRGLSVAVYYSTGDGEFVPAKTGQQYTSIVHGMANIEFEPLSGVRSIKLEFIKANNDMLDSKGNYVYMFSLDEIKLYALGKASANATQVYQSDPITFSGPGGNKRIIAAAIDSCYTQPEGTNIAFYLYGYDSSSGINPSTLSIDQMIPVSPESAAIKTYPSVVNLSDASVKFNPSQPISGQVSFENDTDDSLVVYGMPSSLVGNSTLYVWTNYLKYINGSTIDTGSTGWLYDGTQYSCVFYVDETSGIVIDFQNTTAVLDGKVVTGKTYVTHGVHTFSTTSNWKNYTQYTEFDQPDNPAPNHKYLIEGVRDQTYAERFGYVYRNKARFVAAKRRSFVPKHHFLYSGLADRERFFTLLTYETPTTVDTGVVIEDSSGNAGEILLEYKEQGNVVIDSLVVRAVLSSSADGVSPSIDDVLVKVETIAQ